MPYKKIKKVISNPEMKELPIKEVEMDASQAANLILSSYEWLHTLANKGLQISEKKLNKLQAEGEINLNAMIDYDQGKKIRAGDFFHEYNEQTKDLLKVTDEFKDEVRPVLERVLAKRGVGLTDEQMLMFYFGKDIAAKTFLFMQQKTQINFMINSIKEATLNQYTPQQQQQFEQEFEQEEQQQQRPRRQRQQQRQQRRQRRNFEENNQYEQKEIEKDEDINDDIDIDDDLDGFNAIEPEERQLDMPKNDE